VYPEKILNEIIEMAEKKNSWILSDEIYEKLLYGGTHFSPGSIYEKVITVNGLSKEFSMTGFRLGYCACGIKKLIEKINMIQQQSVSCATSFVQYGALAAFTDEEGEVKREVEIMLEELKKRRDFLYRKLEKISQVRMKKPQGAFYVFPYFEDNKDDIELTERLLKRGVGVIPGSPFGSKGRSCLRISYGAATLSELEKAMNIIEKNI
jgi:aspartate aminotransferase